MANKPNIPTASEKEEIEKVVLHGSTRNAWTWVGYIFIAISVGLRVTRAFVADIQEVHWLLPDISFFFIGSYSLALLFFIIRFIDREKGDTHNYALFLVLFSISAFSLNKEVGIFSPASPWLLASLVLINLPLLASNYRREMPSSLALLFYGLSGLGFLLSLYFTLYILPIIPIGVIAFFLFGLPLHVLAPVLCMIEFARYLWEAWRRRKWYIGLAGLLGVLLPLSFGAWFAISWKDGLKTLAALEEKSIQQYEGHELPSWVYLAQYIPENSLFDKMIQTDQVYDAPLGYDALLGKAGNSLHLNKYHDPLVVFACALFGKNPWLVDNQLKLMIHRADLYHEAQDRLWSTADVETSWVKTSVEIFPAHRLAYVEKEITIHNSSQNGEQDEQEAIYTFYLPEGAAVTSLSLWVNGKEEESVLTTKAQADTAYRQIVGVERRDPALLHWQEGSRVSLRVFPCTPKEDRKFKIGISAPLLKRRKGLTLQNTYFAGPRLSATQEEISLTIQGKSKLLEQAHLNPTSDSKYYYKGAYKPYWELSVEAVPLSDKPFVLEGIAYYTRPLNYQWEPMPLKELVLDVNKAWKLETFRKVYQLGKQMNLEIKVFGEFGWVRLSDTNWKAYFERLSQQNFSILPVGLIAHPEQAVIITKSDYRSPYLSDVQTSSLEQFMARDSTVNVVNIGEEVSPYWKTLVEFGKVQYYQADTVGLEEIFRQKHFPRYSRQAVSLPLSGMKLVAVPNSTQSSLAPDHLMRLYAYNKVVRSIGDKYFADKQEISDASIELAKKAHVVTPLSSLLVLETQEDYEQFDIEKSKDSLENAKLANEGAVPEPGEWLLMGFGAVILCLLAYRQQLLKKKKEWR